MCLYPLSLSLGADLLGVALDHSREVADGELDGEVDRGEEDGREEVPARHAGDEGACSASLFQSTVSCFLYISGVSLCLSLSLFLPKRNKTGIVTDKV